MNYVFFGTPRFAEVVLGELLAAGLPPTAIVCNPDRPVGRKKIVTPPPVKELVERRAGGGKGSARIPVLQPEKLDADFERLCAALHPDFFVVAAYAKIIPQSVLDIARLGTLGTHPSLLPKYRGAAPIQSAILGGETETGVSLYLMDAKMDHGPILASETVPIRDRENYLELEDELARLGGKLLIKILPEFFAGTTHATEQNNADATFTKKFKTEDGFVSPEVLAAAESGDRERTFLIDRMIRALNPEPGVWTLRDGKRTKLLAARIEDGALRLTLIRHEGEKDRKLT